MSLVQPRQCEPVLLKPLHTLSITCSISEFSFPTSADWWYWIYQTSGNRLQRIGKIEYYDGVRKYNPSLTGCIFISRDILMHFSYSGSLWPVRIGPLSPQWGVLSVSPDTKVPARMLGISSGCQGTGIREINYREVENCEGFSYIWLSFLPGHWGTEFPGDLSFSNSTIVLFIAVLFCFLTSTL